MAKSSTSSRRRKPAKPDRPYEGFPLFPHDSGRWAKKIRKKIHFFGRWAHTEAGKLVPVKDTDASAAAAMKRFEREWPYLSEGRTPPPIDTAADVFTMRELCERFLQSKRDRMESGELSLHSFAEYHRTTDLLLGFFGRNRRVDDLRPDEFERFRAKLAKGCGVVTLKSKINRCRVVLKYASDNRYIDKPVDFGQSFDRPSPMKLREARNAAGPRMFERDEVLSLLKAADAPMKAMILLGLNCGFGNTDVATLPRKAVNLDTGWIEFPRPKTAILRRVPLWPETVKAMRAALEKRPEAKDPEDAGLCFLTGNGTRFVRIQESKRSKGKHVTINCLARRFEWMLDDLAINERRGVGFYTLRHVFETIGGQSRDQVAVDSIMGHADPSMGAAYRESIGDDRLTAVVNVVRSWLWPAGSEASEG